ncbi:type IV pilus biogenesis protein PilM [Bacillus sp. CGMCC 1.16607]|uniref:type IV pilus biogenesis protein PilM n=1 Tax=Bacillus sp. CGMCC 1.16607 TaxID=3351842 RepID=UPI00362F58F5
MGLLSRNNRIINIIFNDHSIRYVEVKQQQPPTPIKWGEKLLPHGIIHEGKIVDLTTLTMILEECIGDWKIQRRKVRFLIPDPLVLIRRVKIPDNVLPDEINGYFYLELGTSIHLPFEEPVFETVLLPTKSEKKEVLLFAAPQQHVMEYSQLLSSVKLKPITADISPLALYRLYYQSDSAQTDERLMMIQFDLDRVFICIFEQQYPIFMHHFPIQFQMDEWDIRMSRSGTHRFQYKGDISNFHFQLEDFYKETSKLMDFYRYSLYQGNEQITKVLLNGDHPKLQIILQELQERLDVPIQTIDSNEWAVGKSSLFPHSHFLALGLGLKEV